MQFFEVETAYNLFRKRYGYKDPIAFYKDVVKDYMDVMAARQAEPKFFFFPYISFPIIITEQAWYQEHMPYYKVWPGVFDTFVKTRLDIKAELLRFPHEAFSILLPKTDEPILSFDFNGSLATVQTITVIGDSKDLRKEGYTGINMRVVYRVEDRNEFQYPGSFMKSVVMPLDETIEEGIDRDGYIDTTCMGEEYELPASIIDACVRLTIATIFLATGSHKVLEYDVLAKHLEAYRKMRGQDEDKTKEYEKKARAKGKFGWNIGSGRGDRGLKLPNGVSYAAACQQAGGRELLFQHVRGGHWHSYRYGQGRKEVKIVWQEDITIRKDLPPKPLNV